MDTSPQPEGRIWSYRFLQLGVVLVAVFLFLPSGPVGTRLQERITGSERKRASAAQWQRVADAALSLRPGSRRLLAVVVSDYECHHCRAAHEVISRFLDTHPDVDIGVLHLPLRAIHPLAEQAAMVSTCASLHGRFETVHDRLFASSTWQKLADQPDGREMVQALMLPDPTALADCVEGEWVRSKLAEHREVAREFDIVGTPVFVTRNGAYPGVPSVLDLERSLEQLSAPEAVGRARDPSTGAAR